MKIDIDRLDHFGIVAGVMKDLGIAELVNEKIGIDEQEILTTGDVVAGIILNGLGFASRPLMLSPQFFRGKPLDLLVKNGIHSDHFNRHRIGRAFDVISEFGCEKLFNYIAAVACMKENVKTNFGHADTTSFGLTGNYNQGEKDEDGMLIENKINITYGYSKGHRPDLKQVILELITSNDSGIPLMTKTLSGNESDNDILRQRAQSLIECFNKSTYQGLVADSKLYCEKTAIFLNQINYITRVPSSIKLEKETIALALNQSDKWIAISDDYKYQKFSQSPYEIAGERWIVFYSKHAYDRSKKTLEKEVKKEEERVKKDIFHLQAKQFSCEEDAKKAITTIDKKWHYHTIKSYKIIEKKSYETQGRPKLNTTPSASLYKLEIESAFNLEALNKALDQRSCFVLSTNFSEQFLPDTKVLTAYKGQDLTEKGFAFIKKSEFFTSSINLEKPGRIESLTMLMILSLLVYSVAQRRLRNALQQSNETFPNQINKQVTNPTMRWIFQIFEGIHRVTTYTNGIKKVFIQGLDKLMTRTISLLGGNTSKIYGIATNTG